MNNFWLFAGVMPLLAQAPAPPDLPRSKSVLDTLIAAGPVMYALLAMSIILVMLVVTYFLTIRRGAPTRPRACHRPAAAVATAGPYSRGRPPGPGIARGRGGRRSSRMAALRCMPVTATTSSKSCRFSARVACR